MNNPSNFDLPDDYEARIREARALENDPPSLTRRAVNFLLLVGGVTTVGAIIVPGQVAGASRTAHLKWQHRQAEIAKDIAQLPPESPQP